MGACDRMDTLALAENHKKEYKTMLIFLYLKCRKRNIVVSFSWNQHRYYIIPQVVEDRSLALLFASFCERSVLFISSFHFFETVRKVLCTLALLEGSLYS